MPDVCVAVKVWGEGEEERRKDKMAAARGREGG